MKVTFANFSLPHVKVTQSLQSSLAHHQANFSLQSLLLVHFSSQAGVVHNKHY